MTRFPNSITSDEDTTEVWVVTREKTINKVRKNKGRTTGTEVSTPDEKEIERTDGWVINRKMKWIILLEFERTSDTSKTFYSDVKEVADTQHTPILKDFNELVEDRKKIIHRLVWTQHCCLSTGNYFVCTDGKYRPP